MNCLVCLSKMEVVTSLRCPCCGAVAALERQPQLLDALRQQPINIEDVPWLVKDFDVLFRVSEVALESAQRRGFVTVELNDLREQLHRLRDAFEQCQMVKAALRGQGNG